MRRAQEAQEEEEMRAEEAQEQRRAQEAQEQRTREEREGKAKAQEERREEVRKVQAQEGHEGKEEMTTQGECVEEKKETNSVQEEHDMSNRHVTWWKRCMVDPCERRTTHADGSRPSTSRGEQPEELCRRQARRMHGPRRSRVLQCLVSGSVRDRARGKGGEMGKERERKPNETVR